MTIYTVILIFLHAFVSFLEAVLLTWQGLRRSVRWLMQFGGCPGPKEIRRLADRINKIPVHLGLVIVEDAISFVDIARIVVWSAALGVAYVTIYDHKGKCKLVHNQFLQHLEKQQRLFQNGGRCEKLSIRLHSGGSSSHSPAVPNSKEHGGINSRGVETCVRVIGPDDGKQSIVNVSKQISTAVSRQQMSAEDVTVSYIDSMLQETHGFSDPDLVMKFGKVNSLLGFLPWQMRLSEILFVPTHRNIDLQEFGAALYTFCSTEQRCGK